MNKRDLAEYLLKSVDELGIEQSIKTVSKFLISIEPKQSKKLNHKDNDYEERYMNEPVSLKLTRNELYEIRRTLEQEVNKLESELKNKDFNDKENSIFASLKIRVEHSKKTINQAIEKIKTIA